MRELSNNEINEIRGGLAVLGAMAAAFVAGVVLGYGQKKYDQYKESQKQEEPFCAPTC